MTLFLGFGAKPKSTKSPSWRWWWWRQYHHYPVPWRTITSSPTGNAVARSRSSVSVPAPPPPHRLPAVIQSFSSDRPNMKKKKVGGGGGGGGGGSGNAADVTDPFDFSDLEAKMHHQIDWLKDNLAKLRSGDGSGSEGGGRLGVKTIEALPVEIKSQGGGGGKKGGKGGEKGDKTMMQKVKIGDLATVLPRGGRMMAVLCNEEADVKPITSALQASPYSLNPQQPTSTSISTSTSTSTSTSSSSTNNQNPLQILIPIPPPTAESRQATLSAGKSYHDKAQDGIRDARAAWQRWYRQAEKGNVGKAGTGAGGGGKEGGRGGATWTRDDLRKAHGLMDKLVEKAVGEIKAVWQVWGKGMER